VFNPAKLLLDPYSKAIEGEVQWSDAVFAHQLLHPGRPSELDSAPNMPRSIVVDTSFDWGNDTGHPFVRVGHLRDTRQGHIDAAPGGTSGTARHLRRHGKRSDSRSLSEARGFCS
jgi:hypothetical protein